MAKHYPPQEMLAAYASGSSTPGMSLLVATHLTLSPESRARVGAMESLGGILLAGERPEPVSAGTRAAVMAAIGEAGPVTGASCDLAGDAAHGMVQPDAVAAPQMTQSMPPSPAGPAISDRLEGLPAPLRQAIEVADGASGSGALAWRFRLPGVSEYELPGFDDEHVSLLRARPGASIPQHTHEGTELTLVLSGQLEDQGMTYRRGDVAVCTEDDDHRPRITGEATCICLVVMDGSLRFTGRFSRALNLLAE
ncbi:MAG: ChrR family anti-sigma-E factor [Pseudomonadota bacterium]